MQNKDLSGLRCYCWAMRGLAGLAPWAYGVIAFTLGCGRADHDDTEGSKGGSGGSAANTGGVGGSVGGGAPQTGGNTASGGASASGGATQASGGNTVMG